MANSTYFVRTIRLFQHRRTIEDARISIRNLLRHTMYVRNLFGVDANRHPTKHGSNGTINTNVLVNLNVNRSFFFQRRAMFIATHVVTDHLNAMFTIFPAATTTTVSSNTRVSIVTARVTLWNANPFLRFFWECFRRGQWVVATLSTMSFCGTVYRYDCHVRYWPAPCFCYRL